MTHWYHRVQVRTVVGRDLDIHTVMRVRSPTHPPNDEIIYSSRIQCFPSPETFSGVTNSQIKDLIAIGYITKELIKGSWAHEKTSFFHFFKTPSLKKGEYNEVRESVINE